MHIRCRPSLGIWLQLALGILLCTSMSNAAAQGRSLQALRLPEGFNIPNIFNTCECQARLRITYKHVQQNNYVSNA
jgi:hypothetical protein